MSKHSIDYSALDNKLNKKAYRLDDVKHRIERVAFDVVRFKDNDADKIAGLWQIQNSDEGDYIVSLYDDSSDTIKTASKKTDWEIVSTAKDLHFFYKGDPILKTSALKLDLSERDLSNISKTLPERLATNKKLVSVVLNQLDAPSKRMVINKYPELA